MQGLSDSATCVPRLRTAKAPQRDEHVHSERKEYKQEAVLGGCQDDATAASG